MTAYNPESATPQTFGSGDPEGTARTSRITPTLGSLKIYVLYTLSEAGRKASLLSGGDGSYVQLIPYYVFGKKAETLMRLARVHEDGQAIIYLTDWNPSDDTLSAIRANSPHRTDCQLWANVNRNDGKRCPRRVVWISRNSDDLSSVATLVPLNHVSQGAFNPRAYDYDLPFDESSMLSYLLSLESKQSQLMADAQAEVERQTLMEMDTYRQQLAEGRTRLLEWLKQPEVPGVIITNYPKSRTSLGAMFGDDPCVYVLDDDSFGVFEEGVSRRIQAAAERETKLAEEQFLAQQAKEAAKQKAMDGWVAEKGSQYLKNLFKVALFETAVLNYHRERAAKDVGVSWGPRLKGQIDENSDDNPKGYELELLIAAREKYPDAQVRLAKLTWKKGLIIMPVPTSLVMESPWDDDYVLIRPTESYLPGDSSFL